MNPKFEALAVTLADAWRTGGAVPLPAAGDAPATRAEAYEIQDRMAALIGGEVVGWKVGATVRAVQVFEGHDGPLPGRIFADRCFDSPARIPANLVRAAKIEAEFAFRLRSDLTSEASARDLDDLASRLSFHPAIELAGSRYAPGTGHRAGNTFDGIADNGSGGAAILGAAINDWRGLPFETMVIDARLDDSPPIQAYSGAYRRDPLAIVSETFIELLRRKVPLPKGTCLLTGSLTLPTIIRPGQTLVVKFASLPSISLTLV